MSRTRSKKLKLLPPYLVNVIERGTIDDFAALLIKHKSSVKRQHVSKSISRFKMYNQKGYTCYKCGITANIIIVWHEPNRPQAIHVNPFYYNKELDITTMFTVDHVIPKSKGGPDTIENQQPMCSPCNSAKADTIPKDTSNMTATSTPRNPSQIKAELTNAIVQGHYFKSMQLITELVEDVLDTAIAAMETHTVCSGYIAENVINEAREYANYHYLTEDDL